MTAKANVRTSGWGRGALSLLINNAANTQPAESRWHFETGDTKPVKKVLTLDQFADRCRNAHADVTVAQAVLEDAQNHVVDCQGDLMKAELKLEQAQAEYKDAAGEIPGVPVGR